ncbi:hypothetical protein F1880_002375 [Penicillium rolfsii]|nr:hypothetical protein F1880_002375 [Penicillium rolfsii]
MSNILRALFCFPRRKPWIALIGEADNSDDISQCDEKKPICTNCFNHGIECSFSAVAPTPPASETLSPSATASEISPEANDTSRCSRRFRPYAYSNGGLKQTFKLSKPKGRPQSPIHPTEPAVEFLPFESISLADLHLFHNYTISTYQTMVDDHDANGVWQDHIVQWGMEFPSILHLILALSAIHLAYKNPESRDKYIQQADSHFTFGVRTVTSVLSQLNADNCQKIYMAAVLICFNYFGRGPRPGEYLIFSDFGVAEWQVLMRGVKTIVMSYRDKVFTGILEPHVDKTKPALSDAMRIELHEHTIHVEAFHRVVEQEIMDEPGRTMYSNAIKDLLEIMREVYEKRSIGVLGVGFMHLLIGWLYRLPEELVGQLEHKEPHALVLLAYWAMILKNMDSVWFMKGWSEHVLSGISGCLQREYRPWIEWPLRSVSNN